MGERITLNVGLRWDGAYLIGTDGRVAQRFTDQWQPRAGFTYQVGRTGQSEDLRVVWPLLRAASTVDAGFLLQWWCKLRAASCATTTTRGSIQPGGRRRHGRRGGAPACARISRASTSTSSPSAMSARRARVPGGSAGHVPHASVGPRRRGQSGAAGSRSEIPAAAISPSPRGPAIPTAPSCSRSRSRCGAGSGFWPHTSSPGHVGTMMGCTTSRRAGHFRIPAPSSTRPPSTSTMKVVSLTIGRTPPSSRAPTPSTSGSRSGRQSPG